MMMGDLKFEELALHKPQNEAGFAGAHVPEKNLSKSQQIKKESNTEQFRKRTARNLPFFFIFFWRTARRRNVEGEERDVGGGADQLGVDAVVADPGHGEMGSEEAANRITGMR